MTKIHIHRIGRTHGWSYLYLHVGMRAEAVVDQTRRWLITLLQHEEFLRIPCPLQQPLNYQVESIGERQEVQPQGFACRCMHDSVVDGDHDPSCGSQTKRSVSRGARLTWGNPREFPMKNRHSLITFCINNELVRSRMSVCHRPAVTRARCQQNSTTSTLGISRTQRWLRISFDDELAWTLKIGRQVYRCIGCLEYC